MDFPGNFSFIIFGIISVLAVDVDVGVVFVFVDVFFVDFWIFNFCFNSMELMFYLQFLIQP